MKRPQSDRASPLHFSSPLSYFFGFLVDFLGSNEGRRGPHGLYKGGATGLPVARGHSTMFLHRDLSVKKNLHISHVAYYTGNRGAVAPYPDDRPPIFEI